MKKILLAVGIAALAVSCNNKDDNGKFTVTGEIKNLPDQHVYLEQLFFSNKAPEVLDTADVTKGKFELSGIGTEEGLYRLRLEKSEAAYIFINDASKISFIGDATNPSLEGQRFSTSANGSLRRIMLATDSLQKDMSTPYNTMVKLKEAQVSDSDSVMVALNTEFMRRRENLIKYCFQYSDTAKSPVVAMFAATMAPVEVPKLELPLQGLVKRFPKHTGIADAILFIKQQVAGEQQQQAEMNSKAMPGSMAPDITMNDVNGKPFSLSQLRGKYVLVDFWASWCGPCRGENPNVVQAYNSFKDKNFTVLGVSLDDNKENWVRAIADDKLAWQQISDLKKWRSPVVELYGFNGIPFNVLVDPSGKIIDNNLRGVELQEKLAVLFK